MSKNMFNEIVIASPLDIRHYVLDIPIVKKEYQINAVKFALKSLYPGSEETTDICFYYSQKKVVGIAASSEKIRKYKSKSVKIISPAKLINRLESNAVAVYFSDDWIEIQVIKNRQTEEISTFSSYSLNSVKQKLNKIEENVEYKDLPLKIYSFTKEKEKIDEILNGRSKEIYEIEQVLNSSNVSSSEIFGKEKNNIRKFIFPVIMLVLLVLFGVKLLSVYNSFNDSKINLDSAKKEYEKAKTESEIIKEKQIKIAENSIDKNISINYLLSEISRTSSEIRIISLSYNGKEFKLEAEKANAVKVIEKLSQAEYISEVTMHHSLPKEDGTERFVISGSVKND